MSLIIDADGHFMEPFDLWEQYLEPRYRERAIRLVKDNTTGAETVFIAGRKSQVLTDPNLLKLSIGAGQLERMSDPSFTYKDGPAGAYEAYARVQLMDEQGIDRALVYPTLGLVWECEVGVEDADLAAAYCRAYNNWIIDHCKPYRQRLFPIAHISLLDTAEAVKELRRGEKTIPSMMGLVGEEKFVWGSDFPHAEGYTHPVVELQEAIAGLSESAQQKILGGNAARLYNLD